MTQMYFKKLFIWCFYLFVELSSAFLKNKVFITSTTNPKYKTFILYISIVQFMTWTNCTSTTNGLQNRYAEVNVIKLFILQSMALFQASWPSIVPSNLAELTILFVMEMMTCKYLLLSDVSNGLCSGLMESVWFLCLIFKMLSSLSKPSLKCVIKVLTQNSHCCVLYNISFLSLITLNVHNVWVL